MNYMLIENNTLSSMKKEHFEYIKSDKQDEPPGNRLLGHEKNITCMITITPEDQMDMPKDPNKKQFTTGEYRKKVKFVTGSSDGVVKVWSGVVRMHNQQDTTGKLEMDLKVSKYAVTALAWMTGSKKLVVATADRMISFYPLNSVKKEASDRIEDLVAVP
jgi:hypothetical protein